MARVHLMNVSPGDCTIIEHKTGRVTMIDICDGNLETRVEQARESMAMESHVATKGVRGNFRMGDHPSNPINYLSDLGIKNIFRFILTHPDMDHMDGLAQLLERKSVANFWDTGARRKMNLESWGRQYKKEDWEAYERLIAGKQEGTTSLTKLAGALFEFANKGESQDGLFIVAPNEDLLCDPDENDDINTSSYIINYRNDAGSFVFPGDAHDDSWEYALREHKERLENCDFLLAPHHGRDSDRSYEFLDVLRPKLTYIGNAPSDNIEYGEWSRRGLQIITSNQAGNVVLEIHDGSYDVYVENLAFVEASGVSPIIKNKQGYARWMTVKTKGKVAA